MNNKAVIEFGFSRIWRILQISEGVIHLGLRPLWITPSLICRILHILRKPNSILAKYLLNIFVTMATYWAQTSPILQTFLATYSRFSPVMWSKLKIITIQWKKSRIWDTIDDCYINNLAKNQVSAVLHSHVICRSVSPKFCMETPCLCLSEGHKHGGRKVTETSVTEFCYWNEKLLL